MHIQVNVKSIGSRRHIEPKSFYLENLPTTIKELITESVKTCVNEYNTRLDMTDENPLTEKEIQVMSSIGKIAFGMNYNGNKADLSQATANALQSYEDGIYRIFIENGTIETTHSEEITTGSYPLDTPIQITEDTSVTFVKLVMFSGSLW